MKPEYHVDLLHNTNLFESLDSGPLYPRGMANSEPKKIIIVGGSLGGLFAGIVLFRLGHDVTILERTPSGTLIDQGAGISISTVVPSIYESFKSLISSGSPILEFFNEYDRTGTQYYVNLPDAMQFLKRDGSVKATITGKVPNASTSWGLLYSLLRANFDGRYEEGFIAGAEGREGDGKAEYRTGLRVCEIEDAGSDQVNVHYEDNSGKKSFTEANLVIGADGPSSSVKKLMQPEAERTYSGYVAWRGMVREDLLSKETENILKDNLTFFYYKGGHVVMSEFPFSTLNCD